jgi:hypothetical protein
MICYLSLIRIFGKTVTIINFSKTDTNINIIAHPAKNEILQYVGIKNL